MPENVTQAEPRPRTTRSVVLLVLYVAFLGWLFYEQSTSWPHEGSWATLAYVFLCPGIAFQSFVVLYARTTGRPLARRVLARVVTVPLGLVLAVALTGLGSALAMDGFERAYSPFVAQVGASLAEPCGAAAKYFAIPDVAAFNEQTGRRPTANLSYDGKRFVLAFPGGSIDIDGSTIYYDSAAGKWHRFHNDSDIGRGILEKLTNGLASCKLRSVPAPQ